jgi:acyl-CoA thioester hydrolase
MTASMPSVQPTQRLACRVYYEDTDAAGIVYYANYLRFLERGRTEFLRALGQQQSALMSQGTQGAQGAGRIAFAVRSVQAEYLKPAKLDDEILVDTWVVAVGRAQLVFAQRVLRDAETLLEATIRVACMDPERGRPVAMPRELHAQFQALQAAPAASRQ